MWIRWTLAEDGAAAAPGSVIVAGPIHSRPDVMSPTEDPIAQLRLAHFQDLVGSTIDIDFGHGAVATEVLSAKALRGETLRPGGGFSVMLRAPVTAPAQGVYAVHHPQQGTLELMLCPRRLIGGLAEFELILN